MSFLTPGVPHEDENEVMARLVERDASDQERIDSELDAAWREAPVDSAASAYLAWQQAGVAALLAKHFETFADCVCADRAAPVSEPIAPSPPRSGRELTTDAGAGSPPRLASDPSSPSLDDDGKQAA